MRIGIVGFGRMGAAMAERLVSQGQELVVWNRSADRAAAALNLGGRIARTPAALTQMCDIVVSSLFDEDAIRAVYLGDDGIASAELGGKLVIDTSTVRPELAGELVSAITAASGRFVDSPVVGTIGPAREGQLIALCGGTFDDMVEARSTLALFARAIHTLGPSGAGYAGKLAVNLLKASYWAALGDCLGLAKRHGIASDAILDVIEGTGAVVDVAPKIPVLRGVQVPATFDIRGLVKDLDLMVAAGGGVNQVPVAAGALQAARRALDGGWGERDIAAVALYAATQIAAVSK